MAAKSKLIISAILKNSTPIASTWKSLPTTKLCAVNSVNVASIRRSSFLSSPQVRPLEEYPEVEVVHNAPEWKYVERLLPVKTIPVPEVRTDYPSGWKPALIPNADKLKYLVARTKNHMIPVYLHTRFRGYRRITVVRRIQGDIWALEKELRVVVEKARNGNLCASRINEMSGQIHFHGDYVDVIREHLKSIGF